MEEKADNNTTNTPPTDEVTLIATDFLKITDMETGEVIVSKRG
jgi:hypothetical protein